MQVFPVSLKYTIEPISIEPETFEASVCNKSAILFFALFAAGTAEERPGSKQYRSYISQELLSLWRNWTLREYRDVGRLVEFGDLHSLQECSVKFRT